MRSHLVDIFQQAGVDIIWKGPGSLTIIVLTAEMAKNLGQTREYMGLAPAGGKIAYVLAGSANDEAAAHRADQAAVLAAIVAHELGHLLLPARAHTSIGIMRAHWDAMDFRRASQRNLFFLAGQAKDLRKSLSPNR